MKQGILGEKLDTFGVKYSFLDEEWSIPCTAECPGSEAGSYLRLIDFFVALNSRLESDNEEEKSALPANRRSFSLWNQPSPI